MTRTFVSLVNIYAAETCYINGALNSEGYLDGYLDIKATTTYTSGVSFANKSCYVPFKDLNLYGVSMMISGPMSSFGELGNDGIFRLTKQAMSSASYVNVNFVASGQSFASKRFAFSLLANYNTTISYNNMPWSISASFKQTERIAGQTVAIITHTRRYLPIPTYIPVEFPFGETTGTFQIPTLVSGSNQSYTLSSALLAGSEIAMSSLTIQFSANGTPTPTVLEFA